MIECHNCGTSNDATHKFCSNCGSALNRACPNCGTVNDPSNKFCFNCGSELGSEPAAPLPSADAVTDPGERRLVSVLFADLVGFTTFSEGRDPEDVRSMLTRYYERCREIIDLHGGDTDKFIGDAVMGVWGATGSHEDDAERATRAALDLVDMVAGLGSELGIPDLSARAGVLSGEASVGSGGNQGLVVGDLVNTASRLQSIAPTGGVFVGQSTRDLIGSSIEFADAGEHEVKGKDVPVRAFHARRVVALSTARPGGDMAEAPFVGRDDELRLLKDQLHATGREGRARMVSIIGEGGIGKTRLSTELLRYIDGIAEVVYYHRGRSPSYGDGVTYWALGEMVRQRTGITEGEESAKARMKLRTTVAEYVEGEEARSWVEPRLAALIGLAEMPPGDRSELFGALRTFFQAISEQGTVLMVFEDLHWADEGLLDFIEELVERTTAHPIFVLALARPELLERRRDWGVGRKRTMGMHLSRLDDQSMRSLVEGLAPGLPSDLVGRIAQRTAGVPLHAVEFVRMLLNTGQLTLTDHGYQFQGDAEKLAIPDSVNAAIGARLDRLETGAQELIKDAAVLGVSFSLAALARIRSADPEELAAILRDLVRQEVLDVNDDPRSPERGQYRFVQGLIREVAYSRLSRSERVNRHLEAARHYESADDPELAMVVASHYAAAVEADPGDEELLSRCLDAVVGAAERAEALRSDSQAATLFERAIDMSSNDEQIAELRLAVARCQSRAGREDHAIEAARESLDFFQRADNESGVRRAATILSVVLASSFSAENAVAAVLPIYEASPREVDGEWARLATATSRSLLLASRFEEAIEVADQVLPVLDQLEMDEELVSVLTDKGTALGGSGRHLEASALLRGAADLAGRRDLTWVHVRALNNLAVVVSSDNQNNTDLTEELEALILRLGSGDWMLRYYFFGAWSFIGRGKLDEAAERLAMVDRDDLSEFWKDSFDIVDLRLALVRDGFDAALIDRWLGYVEKYATGDDPQMRDSMNDARVEALLWAGRFGEIPQLAISALPGEARQYPSPAEGGILAAALIGDTASLRQLTDLTSEHFPRGRACHGLVGFGRSFAAALEADIEAAEAEFVAADQLWSDVAVPTTLAAFRAVFATLVGMDNPVGAQAADQARDFFESGDMTLFRELLISRIPDQEQGEVAV